MNRMALLGAGLLVVGVSIAFALLVTFPGMMSGGCTDIGILEERETRSGHNRCGGR